jgi:hypothetical protein
MLLICQKTVRMSIARLFLLSVLFYAADGAHACEVSRQPPRFYAVSPELHTLRPYSYLSPHRAEQGLGTVISHCEESAGRYLQLNLGIKQNKPLSSASDIVLDGTMVNDGCRVENSHLSRERPWTERAALGAAAFRAAQKCLLLDVVELGAQPLQVAPSPLCRATRMAPHEYRFEGSFCFLKVNARTEVLVTPELKESCYDPAYLAKEGIERQDLDVAVNFWVAGDASGRSLQLDGIGKSEYRFTFEEPTRSEDRPIAWSPIWHAEVHFGAVKIRKQPDGQFLSLSLEVDHRARALRSGGTTSDPSAFAAPVAAEVHLAEVSGNGNSANVLATWQFGAVAQPRWIGLLEDPLEKWIEADTLVNGREYELRTLFRDPREDFEFYRTGIPQRLIELKSQMNQIPGLGEWTGIGTLPDLSHFSELGQLPPMTVENGAINSSVDLAQQALEKLAPNFLFPPLYEKWCDGESGRCLSLAGKGSQVLREIVVRFVLDADPEVPQGSTVRLLSVKESNIFGDRRSFLRPAMPSYSCVSARAPQTK